MSYEYHYHTSNCNQTCGTQCVFHHYGNLDSDEHPVMGNMYICPACGMQTWGPLGDEDRNATVYCSANRIKCGYSDGQIIKAIITY